MLVFWLSIDTSVKVANPVTQSSPPFWVDGGTGKDKVLFIPRQTDTREDRFCEAAGPLPRQRCCLQPLMFVVGASWNRRNSYLPPTSSSSVPFFDLQLLIVMGFLVQCAKISTGNMLRFIGVFLWYKIWVGFSPLYLSITFLYFIIHFFKTVGLGKFPSNL